MVYSKWPTILKPDLNCVWKMTIRTPDRLVFGQSLQSLVEGFNLFIQLVTFFTLSLALYLLMHRMTGFSRDVRLVNGLWLSDSGLKFNRPSYNRNRLDIECLLYLNCHCLDFFNFSVYFFFSSNWRFRRICTPSSVTATKLNQFR
jgi:hypothetical protein